MSRTATTETLPIWRSQAQPAILYAIFHWDQPTAAHIAARFGLSRQEVNTEAHRLEDAGIVRAQRVGRSRVLSPVADHPAVASLRSLAELTIGPLADLHTLYRIEGVDAVYVFGSWARRHHGEPGPNPRDIDVLVVGAPDKYAVTEACLELSGRHTIEVNPMVATRDRFDSPEPGSIIEEVLASPLVSVRR